MKKNIRRIAEIAIRTVESLVLLPFGLSMLVVAVVGVVAAIAIVFVVAPTIVITVPLLMALDGLAKKCGVTTMTVIEYIND